MRLGLAFGVTAALFATAANADSAVDIDRAVFVERQSAGVRSLEPASTLRPGQTVVLVLQWRAAQAGKGFTVASVVPRHLAFQRAGNDAVEVSADGGRRWGRIGELTIGSRVASPEDVTNLRLRIPGGAREGRLTWSAIVR